jgi:hypothetical protein
VIGDPKLSDPVTGKFVEKDLQAGEKLYRFRRTCTDPAVRPCLPNQEFLANVQLSALNLVADPLVLPVPPKLVEKSQTKGISTQGEKHELSSAPEGNNAGPFPTCLSPEPGWSLVPNSEDISYAQTIPGCVTATKAFSTESKACYNITMSVNAGHNCRAIWNVTAKQNRPVKEFQYAGDAARRD